MKDQLEEIKNALWSEMKGQKQEIQKLQERYEVFKAGHNLMVNMIKYLNSSKMLEAMPEDNILYEFEREGIETDIQQIGMWANHDFYKIKEALLSFDKERQLEREFAKKIGVHPSMYLHMIGLDNATISRLEAGLGKRFSQISELLEFSDFQIRNAKGIGFKTFQKVLNSVHSHGFRLKYYDDVNNMPKELS